MLKLFSKIFLKIIGWKIKGQFPTEIKKAVVIAAPHTSGWDFIIGRAGFHVLGIRKINFLIKKEAFKFPVGPIIKVWGAIPVDRGKNNNTITMAGKMFQEKENLLLLITPEGTRKYTEHWKKGFYFIAFNAKVPIVLSYVDYGKKEGGIGPVIFPSGNFEEDFKLITDFYKTKTAKFPEDFNLSQKS
jgi:1-acyl-sn-glycerol-3-phosphate acyltransferase